MKTYQDYSEIPYRVKEISFDVERFTIVGDLLLPQGAVHFPLIVFVWGSGEGGRHLVGRPSTLMTTFIRAGYAVFIEDKPGCGASTGVYSEEHLLQERARILAKEIAILRQQPEVCPERVGVYGSSQASYVMTLALESSVRYDFMVAVSCPAMDSVRQSAYLVKQQLLCAGYPLDQAAQAETYYIQRDHAQDYHSYLEAAQFLDANPVVRDDLDWGGIREQAQFSPRDTDWEEFYDPGESLSALTMPVLTIFGEKDTQVNPVQGYDAYQTALEQSGNPHSKVVLLPGTDHNMRVTTTGCLKEQMENYSKPGGAGYNPEFLSALETWLVKLKRP